MAFIRIKAFWGALDAEFNDESPYTPTQTKALGPDANEPNIAVRRAQIVFSRLTQAPPQDAMATHLDFLNITNGEPDDSWTDADFVLLENAIQTFLTQTAGHMYSGTRADQIRWYRAGAGVLPPNPAVRIHEIDVPGTATSQVPPQVAVTSTFKTVPRRQWGRAYWPWTAQTTFTGDGRLSQGTVVDLAANLGSLFDTAIAGQFIPVIVSRARGKTYGIEQVKTDDVPDVIRSRRVNESTFNAFHPL
jgi:hypothetical protein